MVLSKEMIYLWHIDGILKGIMIPGLSGPGSNKGKLHIYQIFWTGVSPSDIVCHAKDTKWFKILQLSSNIAQLAVAIEYPKSVLDMTLNNLMVRFQWCCSFGDAEHPFITIAPRSSLARNGSTW